MAGSVNKRPGWKRTEEGRILMKTKKEDMAICHVLFVVPGAGVEPARVAPLVFETSASTDSAIRAQGGFGLACDRAAPTAKTFAKVV